MAVTPAKKPRYLQRLEDHLKETLAPQANGGMQQTAWQVFVQHGFLTNQSESWRYTPLKRLSQLPVKIAVADGCDTAACVQRLNQDSWLQMDGLHVVMVDGRFQVDLSTPKAQWPAGVSIDAIEVNDSLLDDLLESNPDPMVCLNHALAQSRLLIQVADGVQLSSPILIHHLTSQSTWQGSQVSVRIGKGAYLPLIERQISANHDVTACQLQTSVLDLAPQAHCRHVVLQQLNQQSVQIDDAWVHVNADSIYQRFTLLDGAHLGRNQTHAVFDGENATVDINSLVIATNDQALETRTRVHHQHPHCYSMQTHQILAWATSQCVFDGMIKVEQEAQKTDGNMSNHNLLLSPSAKVDTKPQLEIYADDVACSHGVTSGQLDENALFYLQARGIDAAQAQAMLVSAFAQKAVPEWLDTLAPKILQRDIEQSLAAALSSHG